MMMMMMMMVMMHRDNYRTIHMLVIIILGRTRQVGSSKQKMSNFVMIPLMMPILQQNCRIVRVWVADFRTVVASLGESRF
jgi:hypothetical protein